MTGAPPAARPAAERPSPRLIEPYAAPIEQSSAIESPEPESPEPERQAPVAPVVAAVADLSTVTPATSSDPVHPAPPPDRAGCTAPQLRRFIKSRVYVPMHELRRRFGINGTEDDVTLLDVDGRRVYVGLPVLEGRLLGELVRGGDVGYELSLDPRTPIVVGVYPMRPVPRP